MGRARVPSMSQRLARQAGDFTCGTPFNATFTCVLVHMVNGTTRARRGCNPCSRRICGEATISIERWPCWWRRSSPKPGSHQRCCPGPRYVIRFVVRFIIGHGHWVQGTKSADEVDLQNNELFPCVSFQKRRWRKRITTLRLCRQTSRTSLCKYSITDAFFYPGCWRTKVMGQFEIEVCIKWMCTATIPTRQNFAMCQKNGLIHLLRSNFGQLQALFIIVHNALGNYFLLRWALGALCGCCSGGSCSTGAKNVHVQDSGAGVRDCMSLGELVDWHSFCNRGLLACWF